MYKKQLQSMIREAVFGELSQYGDTPIILIVSGVTLRAEIAKHESQDNHDVDFDMLIVKNVEILTSGAWIKLAKQMQISLADIAAWTIVTD